MKHYLIILQAVIVILCFPVFYFFGTSASPLHSFVFSFLAYWFFIAFGSTAVVIFDQKAAVQLKEYFQIPRKKILILINFIPSAAVLFIVFLPALQNIHVRLFSTVLVIALFNGTFEEIFWRGLVLSKYASSAGFLAVSTCLFGIYHFAFLLLPLKYQGGAPNLVGGAVFMGLIWLIVSRYTKNILYSIFAHILVNCFTFSGLFVDNQLL